MTLRFFLALFSAVLVCVALAYAVEDFWRNRALVQKVAILAQRNRLADDCLQSVASFAFERGRVNIVLRGAAAVSADNRSFIDAQRERADRHIERVLAATPNSAEVKAQDVRRAWSSIQSLRDEVDRDIALPTPQRDPSLPVRWMDLSDDLIDRLERLLVASTEKIGDGDPYFDRLAALRVSALHFRVLVGKLATQVGAQLSSGKLPGRAALREAYETRGRIDQLWSVLEASAEGLGDVAVFQFVARAQAQVLWVLRPLQDEILLAGEAAVVAPMPVERYVAAAVPALEATAALADSINRSAEKYVQRQADEARRSMVFSGGGIVCVLVACSFAAWFYRRRFASPLDEILRRIDVLLMTQAGNGGKGSGKSGGKSGDDSAGGGVVEQAGAGGDELDKVQQALSMLDSAIAARMATEAALRASESVNASILACAPQAIISTDLDGVITVFSPGAAKMLGYSAADVVGKQTPLLFHDPDEIREHAERLAQESGMPVGQGFGVFVARLRAFGEIDESEWIYIRRDGHRLKVMLTVTFLRDASGDVCGCLGVATDVTERAAAAARMSMMAYHDPLTQLPNRRLLHDRLQVAIAQARRSGNRLAMMLIDLDRFKPVNDQFGHEVGDIVLRTVAGRMRACLRESDTLARVGGDEFVAVVPGIDAVEDALGVAEKIRAELVTPIVIDNGPSVSVAGSIGVALFPDHGESERVLQNRADEAMYVSKSRGRNCVTLYEHAMQPVVTASVGENVPVLRLVWHGTFQCGVAMIDNEHRGLFERANAVFDAMLRSSPGDGGRLSLLDPLIRDVEQHFAHEEALLEKLVYRGAPAHALRHRLLLKRVHMLHRRVSIGEIGVGDLVAFLVQEVVFRHLLHEDVAYFEFVRQAMRESDEQQEAADA
ncbi:diguanylate cyclase domain-containing protein [Propionivibrio dicarboxylicus]|nr:diguanylate cyclase [Propionivibrio dicarboxylicus]